MFDLDISILKSFNIARRPSLIVTDCAHGNPNLVSWWECMGVLADSAPSLDLSQICAP